MYRASTMSVTRQFRLVRGHGEDARLDSFLLAADPLLIASPPSQTMEPRTPGDATATEPSDLTGELSPDSTAG